MKENGKNLYFPMGRRCPICGKEFFPRSEWGYRAVGCRETEIFYCSYPCMRRAETDAEERRRAKKSAGRYKAVLMLDRDGKLLRKFSDAYVAATLLGLSVEGIRLCCRGKQALYRGYAWRYEEGTKHD